MNKENKRQAMERRAQERQAQEKKKRIRRMLENWVPVVIIAVVVVVLLVAIITSGADRGGDEYGIGDSGEPEFDLVDENGNALDITDWTEIDEEDGAEADELDTTEGRIAADGDTVNIDYVGRHNGETFEGGSSENEDVTIGAGGYIDGFEEGIVGHAVGETFEMPVTFPEGYGGELGGEEIIFTVTLNGIYR